MLLPFALARLRASHPTATLLFLLRWLLISCLIGALAGTASAGFLVALDWATRWREAHPWALALLPGAGLLIGGAYHYFGNRVVRGNNLILDEIHRPTQQPPVARARPSPTSLPAGWACARATAACCSSRA